MLTLGAALGGFVAGWFGTNAAFVLDSLSFVASALLIASVRFPKRPAREKAKLTVGKALGISDTIEGARYVKHRPRVLAYLMVKPAWGMGGGILTFTRSLRRENLSRGRQDRHGHRRSVYRAWHRHGHWPNRRAALGPARLASRCSTPSALRS